MSHINKGLGRGLEALWSGRETGASEAKTESLLAIDLLKTNPKQPRRHFDPQALEELAESIREQGIIQPILVRPLDNKTYQIVAGERRWRAARMAGLTQVPVYIREMDEKEAMAAALIENLQREDLNPLEEALALQTLKNTLNMTQEELAARIGKSRPGIANTLRLLQLSPAAQEDLRDGRLSAGQARCLLGITDTQCAEHLRQEILTRSLTVRQVEEAVAFWRQRGILPWTAQPEETKQKKSQKKQNRKIPEIHNIEQSLTQRLPCRASMSGTMENGRITLKYASHADLLQLLQKLGIDHEELDS